MATPYIGNNDFRGYLNYLGQNGDNLATDALSFTGNDGGINPNISTYNFDRNQPGSASPGDLTNYINNAYKTYSSSNGHVPGDSTGGSSTPSPDLSLFDSNAANLNDLLGRTDTYLNQGLANNEDQYNTQVGSATTDKNNQVQTQTQNKQSAYDKINQNAGTGYNSLSQIIGRAAGTGSSAYQQLLPDVIGKDTSSKRLDATNTYGQNLSKIDTSFAGVLQDLLNQKKQNEDSLRSGVETQRQNINQELAQNAQGRAQAAGQTPAQAVAAAQPFQSAIQGSRDAVQNFFDQFRTPYTAPALAPDLSTYTTDPAQISAGQQGGDASDPYSALLRNKLQGNI